MTRRRKYSPKFKREAIALTRQLGAGCRQITLEIGINPNLLSKWRREADAKTDKAFKGTGSPRDEELARVKRELARVKKARDFSAKRQCTSLRNRPEVSGDSRLSQSFSDTPYVPMLEGVRKQL